MARGCDPIFGDLGLSDEMRSLETKGNLIAWRRRWLAEEYGEESIEQLAAQLAGEARDYLLEPPSHFVWRPLGPMMDLDRAIVEGPMRGDLSRMREFGARIGAGDFSTVYKLVVRLAVTPRMLAARIAAAYETYFRPGTGVVEEEGSTYSIVGATRTVPLYLCTHGVVGWFTSAARLTGARDGAVNHVACRHRGDPRCLWEFSWS